MDIYLLLALYMLVLLKWKGITLVFLHNNAFYIMGDLHRVLRSYWLSCVAISLISTLPNLMLEAFRLPQGSRHISTKNGPYNNNNIGGHNTVAAP